MSKEKPVAKKELTGSMPPINPERVIAAMRELVKRRSQSQNESDQAALADRKERPDLGYTDWHNRYRQDTVDELVREGVPRNVAERIANKERYSGPMKAWAPRSVPTELQSALAVLTSKTLPMSAPLHRMLMEGKLTALVKQAESSEQATAQELLPDLQLAPPPAWPRLILMSDPMQAALSQIDWDREQDGRPLLQSSVMEALTEQSLVSLLGSL